jgi:hypothetical protein
MDDPDGYFGDRVAASYDNLSDRMFQPEAIDPAVDGIFTVAYLVYNTINNLTTQEAQIACFRNVAAHLAPGGASR